MDELHRRRIYPLSPRDLSEEQIAVTFAMTSRSPEPFDEIARRVTEESAASFNERWVVGYGHASVAEHAVLHLAVENISRLACDTLEDNRLASYTEKSSRYQVIDPDSFHVPQELDPSPALRETYLTTCRNLFATYHQLIDGTLDYLRRTLPQRENERDSAYNLRLRRLATDACRAILPAATLTNVGVTANARTLEHAITKLMSSALAEEREIGLELREQGRNITPTLVKYADHNPYLAELRAVVPEDTRTCPTADWKTRVALLDYDSGASRKLAAALLFRNEGSYSDALARSSALSEQDRLALIHDAVRGIGPHDPPPREFELVGYTFEFTFDYGALREFRRHRMQTYLSQPLTVSNGYHIPDLIRDAGLEAPFERAINDADTAFHGLQSAAAGSALAQYLVTHAHRQRVLSRLSLRECYHLFKLRASQQAHESIRVPIVEAMRLAVEVQPELFRYLPLRNAPNWWPFTGRSNPA
ncbi:MAG: FAD-dependent thymidylate synthase [Chloroflexota bacterium]|nr:FAD-dependent thymidylate synthase [Chloroflexota bacterium]MDE2685696.1 FAD-dependent thymidylate synthase [Chloroflexota bacterium]